MLIHIDLCSKRGLIRLLSEVFTLQLSNVIIRNPHPLNHIDSEVPYLSREDEEWYLRFVLACQV